MLISLRQCVEPLTQLHRLWVKAYLEFLVCSISQEPLKIPLNFDQMFILVWWYVEPSPLSCHSLYNKMLHISDCLLGMGDYSCPSTALLFIKGTDTFGYNVWTIYTSHTDHFTPQHTAFEKSTACLSVFLESLPAFIPFAILWHAGLTLEKKQLHEHELQLSDYNI